MTAHRLRTLLLRLVDAPRRLAHSSALLIVFLPAFGRDIAPSPRRSQALGAQRAQIAAIKAYNRQIGQLARLSGAAQRERSVLADRLH